MNTAWHYWCGVKNFSTQGDRYARYLLISADSLIQVGGVDPSDIYATVDTTLIDSKYIEAARKRGINIINSPIYANYSKQFCYTKVLNENPSIDQLAQIDCDTIVTDSDILGKVQSLDSAVNIKWAGRDDGSCGDSDSTYMYIENRDGQKHGSPQYMASVNRKKESNEAKAGCPIRYESFKDFLMIQHGADLDELVENSKTTGGLCGYFYVLNRNLLSQDFFKFLCFFNFFFEDDEVSLDFARYHFNLKYGRDEVRQMCHQAITTDDFEKFKGVVHFPSKDDELNEYMTDWANKLV